MATKLKLVDPPEKPPVDIAQMWRDEARQRDWGRVHVEGDRREPVFLTLLRKVHRL